MDPDPRAPQPHALTLLRSLTGIVDQATAVSTAVADNPSVLNEVTPELRARLMKLCDAVFDLDYRTANLSAPPPGVQLPLS
ncbi:MAG: hypothetical protein H7Y15_05355 [Pseudonocardia sp.]|nr:hypothetical protein [Pseudonocardia sp.]